MRLVILLLLLLSHNSSNALKAQSATEFLHCLQWSPELAERFVHPDDLAISHRLGIEYQESPAKALISWDLTEATKRRLAQSRIGQHIQIERLDEHYDRLTLFPDDSAFSQSWIFKDGRQTSSILYGVRDWLVRESKYFRFYLSDPSRFHDQNIKDLEAFLIETADLLGLSKSQMRRLESEKIIYCFCSDQQEIRDLTGFSARGMYILSHDLIVSTYSSHLHELAHLLINYRLETPHLYTHPMLLEGFAVAIGGRGGKAPRIHHQLGVFLHRSGWLSINELLGANSFAQQNASMSYPGSAPYNRFLIEHLGIESYLDLYLESGGDAEYVSQLQLPRERLPDETSWQAYLDAQPTIGVVVPATDENALADSPTLFQRDPDRDRYRFVLPEMAVIGDGAVAPGYTSFLFEELVPDRSFPGGRYLFQCSPVEIGLYDLYTNTMIGHYAATFAKSPTEVPTSNGQFDFFVDAKLFESEIDESTFTIVAE